ncbi:hypothetical protein AZH43_11480 [Acinetobacter pragensis]|uniref:Uncharacterized protein n=1 Tax=Acinetobacter pragensis TaxID=1806892 RepID=A0A151Y239_9GAMM|nr:hypothetical protein AZH43_11480 [Acinetobacter pragensis]
MEFILNLHFTQNKYKKINRTLFKINKLNLFFNLITIFLFKKSHKKNSVFFNFNKKKDIIKKTYPFLILHFTYILI